MYYFLSASLPGLALGRDPGMSVADFDELCAGQLPPGALARRAAPLVIRLLFGAGLAPARVSGVPLPGLGGRPRGPPLQGAWPVGGASSNADT